MSETIDFLLIKDFCLAVSLGHPGITFGVVCIVSWMHDLQKLYLFLSAGETTYNLEHANDLRVEIQKVYEFIDALR